MYLDSIYRVLGVPASLTIGAQSYSARVVDKTVGVEVGRVGEIAPAFAIRTAELEALGLSAADLIDAAIEANGTTYTVRSYEHRPPGELLLLI